MPALLSAASNWAWSLKPPLSCVDLLLDVGVGDLDALLLGRLLDELGVDEVVDDALLEVEESAFAVSAGEHVRVLLLELLELLVDLSRGDGLAVDLGGDVLLASNRSLRARPVASAPEQRHHEQNTGGLHRPRSS